MTTARENVLLAGAILPKHLLDEENRLLEFETLARSAGVFLSGRFFQHRDRFDPTFVIGKGKVEEIALACVNQNIAAVLFLNDLSPVQQRNIERETNCRVVDRTGLILDIFAQRARTREGQLQVELAQLRYQLPRLVGKGVVLSRLGGGIGTRGPGEQKLETDRRRIEQRIKKIEQEIEDVRKHRRTLRQGRQRQMLSLVSLVGYTNAGKTSLLNRLTSSQAWVADQFFATLDPLVRKLRLPNQSTILVSDTVGFLQDFPPQLAAAFRATLEELEDAVLLLHVVDGAHPNLFQNVASVQETLEELRLDKKPFLFVVNKLDRISPTAAQDLQKEFPGAFFVSAKTGEGMEKLKEAIQLVIPAKAGIQQYGFPPSRE